MKETLFLGIAAVLDAIGAFSVSVQHRYTGYSCFVGAAVMVITAIGVAYRGAYRLRRGKEELGRILVELSLCELAAYNGNNQREYDELLRRLDKLKNRIAEVGKKYLDPSIESRFLAVNVLDVQLDEATKRHFLDRAQGCFWTVYQQIKGWRTCVDRLLQDLPR
jgi:hypothetical protein